MQQRREIAKQEEIKTLYRKIFRSFIINLANSERTLLREKKEVNDSCKEVEEEICEIKQRQFPAEGQARAHLNFC